MKFRELIKTKNHKKMFSSFPGFSRKFNNHGHQKFIIPVYDHSKNQQLAEHPVQSTVAKKHRLQDRSCHRDMRYLQEMATRCKQNRLVRQQAGQPMDSNEADSNLQKKG